MTATDRPPVWAETLLRFFLDARNRDAASGDLLEMYRDEIVPARRRAAADRWYVGQVAGFIWRTTWLWSLAFAAAFAARTAYDWFVPTTDFFLRSEVTTYTAIGLTVAVSLWSAWRARSIAAGALSAVAMMVIAAAMNTVVSLAMLGLWHDTETLAAAQNSGGLGEVFVLPFMAIVPAFVVGTLAGIVGRAASGVWQRLRLVA
jgi:hypothetical protein